MSGTATVLHRIECADCDAWMVGPYDDLHDFMRAHYRVTVEPIYDGNQGCANDPLICLFGTEATP